MTPDQGRPSAETPPPGGLDDAAWPVSTAGQVAFLLGVQPAFLRRLGTQQVIRPARPAGGQRRDSRTEISRIEQVARLAGEGFTLAAIRAVLALQSEVTELRRQLAAEQARPAAPPGALSGGITRDHHRIPGSPDNRG